MKVFILLLLASGNCLSHPVVKTWTFHELENTVERMMSLDTNHADDEYNAIGDAFDLIMRALYTGEDNYVLTTMLSPSGSKDWTKEDLEGAMNDTNTDPNLLPYITSTHQTLIMQNSGNNTDKMKTTQIWVPALDISTWTQEEVTNALKDPNTKGPMYYHFKRAQKKFKEAEENGEERKTVSLITPVGLIRQEGVKPKFITKIPINDTYTLKKHYH